MKAQLQLGNVAVDVVWKNIRNVHLSVHPPTGRVTISAPSRLSLDALRVFAISKLGWIRQQAGKLTKQEREAPREYLNRESHYVWGRRYLLKVMEANSAPSVELSHNRMMMQVRPGRDQANRQEVLEAWYREQLKTALPAVVAKWQRVLGVQVERCFVQRMRTKWGSCNPPARTIRLNTELAKKPRECLDYIVLHEMVHLLEPTHCANFINLMDQFMPKWQHYRDILNRLPVRYESWG
jgi:predicted metal-dependent hydrolase